MPKAPTKRTLAPPAPEVSLPFDAKDLRTRLAAWYAEHARALPWRNIHDPYATWLSEIMLQQTRVATVLERYGLFLQRFPTLQSLAKAQESQVLALWSGLGYYRRARMLHRGAQFVVRELNGQLPRTAAELRTLPGIGDYTGAAIASIAFGESVAVLDGNVERVLLRLLGAAAEGSPQTGAPLPTLNRTALTRIAQQLVPPAARSSKAKSAKAKPASAHAKTTTANPPGDHNQAMMELGATICLPRAPLCLQCPVVELCRTRGEHPTADRAAQHSRVVAHLLAVRKRGTRTEVLLQRRPATASLMPNMLELPPLPLEAVEGREPVLRLRHAITTTNYYVQIYASGAPGLQVSPSPEEDDAPPPPRRTAEDDEDYDAVFTADPAPTPTPTSPSADSAALLAAIPAAAADLEWVVATHLLQLPLTGLARKVLQRLGVMQLPKLQIG
jgi:A/G-specific adenine glycosylase